MPAEGVPHDRVVLVSHEQEPNGARVLLAPEPVDVEEEKIDEEVVTVNLEVDLPPDERKPSAELPERVDDAVDEPLLELSLRCTCVERQEVEHVRIARDLLRQIGVSLVEDTVEVGQC